MGRPFQDIIQSIWGGISVSENFNVKGQYTEGIGIDPDLPEADSAVDKPSGFIRPTSSEAVSGALVNATPMWIETNPKNTNVYSYLSNGRLISYDSALSTETHIGSTFTVTIASPAVFSLTAHGLAANDEVYFSTSGALPTGLTAGTKYYVISAGLTADAFEVSTSAGGAAVNTSGTQSGTHTLSIGSGNGLAYYDNYYYLFRERNVSRYGPLNGSPAFTLGYWVTTLGKTALTDTTYPAINGVTMPNHVAHRHTDNALYFCDVTSGNLGIISKIATSKTTVEGDTNNGSAYNALDLPAGYYPTSLASYGTSLAIGLIEGTDTTIRQGKGKVAFWDTTSDSFDLIIDEEFPDPLITALKNVNGVLYVFSGSASGGCRVSAYIGGYSHREIAYLPNHYPPVSQGAVDAIMNRVVFGTHDRYWAEGVLVGVGSAQEKLGKGVHNIFCADGNNMATAVKFVQNSAFPLLSPIYGNNSSIIYKQSTTHGTSTAKIDFEWFEHGRVFQLNEIEIPLPEAVNANESFVVHITDSLATYNFTVNNTNYPNTEQFITMPLGGLLLKNRYFIELEFTGSSQLTVGLPIKVRGEELNG